MRLPRSFILAGPAAAIIALDQATKYLVQKHLAVQTGFTLTEGLLNLVHVRNRGAAFGMFHSLSSGTTTTILALVSILVVVLLTIYALRAKELTAASVLSLSLITGGALGNLVDRIIHGEVIDFIDFYVGKYHWPAFNVADSAITVGSILFALLHLGRGKKQGQG